MSVQLKQQRAELSAQGHKNATRMRPSLDPRRASLPIHSCH